MAVIPRTCMEVPEEASGRIFCKENTDGVKAPTYKGRKMLDPSADRREQACHSVDGEHPDGGMSHQLHLPPLERFQSRPEDFQTPAHQAAENKSFFHHALRMPEQKESHTCL